ncbi:hypothetical protein MMC09_001809 [Bachmanniomyces sp. S44760]|nr:hypothetical protein [Bachmanniomyces sp. S44760]
MGLAALKTGWQRQTYDLGHLQASKYSILIFDNRGIGESDVPLLRYSTSEMALDTLELLQHVGWISEQQKSPSLLESPPAPPSSSKPKRNLHILGISMGGMIAQELALLIPSSITTLCLLSTAPRLINTTTFLANARQRINMFIPRPIDTQLTDIKLRLLSTPWINEPDAEGTTFHFPTNGDRFAAQELSKRANPKSFTRKGFLCQILAAGWHSKNKSQLTRLADQVGRRRIMVVHGGVDGMITVHHAHVLVEELGTDEEGNGVEKVIFENKGHILLMEVRGELGMLLERLVDRGEKMNVEEVGEGEEGDQGVGRQGKGQGWGRQGKGQEET